MAALTFLLSFLSPETNSPSHEMKLEADADAVAEIVGATAEDFDHRYYFLDVEELAALAKLPGHHLADWDGDVVLSELRWLDSIPYLIHTGFELPLMLDGRKPFAKFNGEREWLETSLACFWPHVESGRIIARKKKYKYETFTSYEFLFALPGEEWRFEAHDALFNEPPPWTDEKERREGRLLGYTEEQCDWWSANRKRLTDVPW